MALGPVHCGSFFMFAAFVLLLIVTLSAPIINAVGFVTIRNGGQKMELGTFGYCNDVRAFDRGCSKAALGYDVTNITGGTTDYTWSNDTLNHLTKALVLFPIAAAFALIGFVITLFADHLGFILASFFAFLAFIVSLVAMIIDFVMFGIVKHEINDNTNASASYGIATWLALASTIVLFFSVFIVFFSCCTHRRNKRKDYDNSYNNAGFVGNAGPDGAYVDNRPWHKRFFGRNKHVANKY